ncbi:MAG: SGNH/GDSL hydrolase family protein [Rhodospirillales bacterium]|nr:SGNH/GDSL hydrolase family protein [Rhodospirillales bacterium]
MLLITGVLLEAAARVVHVYREEIRSNPLISGVMQRSLILDSYEMPSPSGLYHWVLRPGYTATLKKVVAQKKMAGHDLGASVLQTEINDRDKSNGTLFRINEDGFKGSELDKAHARPRILALGDSTTFGLGAKDYPRRLEANLNGRGIPVEVVNGGVEGYSPRNVLFEIERYKALKPEIVTLYIGWNALFSNVPWKDAWENRSRAVWLYKRASRTIRVIVGDQQAFAMKMYSRTLKPDVASTEVQSLHDYVPPFMNRIEEIIDEFESIGTRVVLVTLPGLFTMSEVPSQRALKIGHLPYFTENPFVLAKLTERYNTALRGLAKRRRLDLVDLEEWSVQALRPREEFFSDSVHLTPRGLDKIGAFMADEFAKQLLKNP